MTPSISIITPSFNQAQFIEQTIDSVLSQGYEKLEYMVIDGGSTDQSAEIIRKYARHLSYWISEPDRGQSHAINKGIARSTGDVINWLNSDDYLEPGALNFVGEVFADPSVIAACARSNIVMNGEILRQSRGTDVYPDNLAKTIGWARIDQPETFFRKKAYDMVGPLNEALHYVMDREWWIRYLLHFGLGGVKTVDRVIVNFRLHDQSKTQGKRPNFEVEHYSLYGGLAMDAGLDEEAKLIQSEFGAHPMGGILSNKLVPPVLLRDVLNYFLLHQADQAYQQGRRERVQRILNSIQFDLLEAPDRKLYHKLKLRSSIIPPFLLKWKNKKSL